MDYQSYRRRFFADPQPKPRYELLGLHGTALNFSDYEAAVAYYERVLGPPAYVEGKNTHGWPIGSAWLTLLRGTNGNPRNVEVAIVVQTPQEAERLQAAFVEAGGQGDVPTDQLMYEPVRFCPVTDPFGTNLLVVCPLPGEV